MTFTNICNSINGIKSSQNCCSSCAINKKWSASFVFVLNNHFFQFIRSHSSSVKTEDTDGAHVTAIGDIFQISVMAVRIWSLYSGNLCNSHYWYFRNQLLCKVSPMTVSKSFLELYAQVTVITDIRCCQMKPKSDGLPEISPMAVMKESVLFSSHVTVISDISPKDRIFSTFCYSHCWHFQNLSNFD